MSDDRAFPNRPLLGVSVAVVRDDRVLLAARANAPMCGVWTLPGGLVETGEHLAVAALRELAEEVGVVARIVGPSLTPTEIVLRGPDGRVQYHYVVHPHAAVWESGDAATGPEALDVRWSSVGELDGLEATPGLSDTVREAMQQIEAQRSSDR